MSNQGDQSTSQTQSFESKIQNSKQDYYTHLARIALNCDLVEVHNMLQDHLAMLREKRTDRSYMLVGVSPEGPARIAELEEQIEHHLLCVKLYEMVIKRKVR